MNTGKPPGVPKKVRQDFPVFPKDVERPTWGFLEGFLDDKSPILP